MCCLDGVEMSCLDGIKVNKQVDRQKQFDEEVRIEGKKSFTMMYV